MFEAVTICKTVRGAWRDLRYKKLGTGVGRRYVYSTLSSERVLE